MEPKHAIPPVRGIRRRNAKKMHLTDEKARDALRGEIGRKTNYEPALCGQKLPMLSTVVQRLYNAEQITCNDCLLANVRNLLDRMSQPLTLPKEPTYDSEGNIL